MTRSRGTQEANSSPSTASALYAPSVYPARGAGHPAGRPAFHRLRCDDPSCIPLLACRVILPPCARFPPGEFPRPSGASSSAGANRRPASHVKRLRARRRVSLSEECQARAVLAAPSMTRSGGFSHVSCYDRATSMLRWHWLRLLTWMLLNRRLHMVCAASLKELCW